MYKAPSPSLRRRRSATDQNLIVCMPLCAELCSLLLKHRVPCRHCSGKLNSCAARACDPIGQWHRCVFACCGVFYGVCVCAARLIRCTRTRIVRNTSYGVYGALSRDHRTRANLLEFAIYIVHIYIYCTCIYCTYIAVSRYDYVCVSSLTKH